jgi:anaerobic selenocysteine-containing dehydrogenase
MGVAGGGTNIFRGHDNVQGATDMGLDVTTLPAYYGLVEGAWKHWCRVWDVDYEWVKGRFADKAFMEKSGIPVSRWFDGVLEDKANLDQPSNVKAMVFWGHAPNSQTRLPDMKRAMEQLDLLLVVDPHPTVTAVLSDRTNGVYLLPSTTQMECAGSVTASNRSLQWREQVIQPRFESKTDHEIMYLFAQKFGYANELFKHIQVEGTVPVVEDILREINRGAWTIGYTGQSPERLKLHMENQQTFDKTSLRAVGGPCDGDYYGLPWPCWGTAEMKHPGTANLYDTSLPVKDGGLCFRANFGVERDGQNLLAEGSWNFPDPVPLHREPLYTPRRDLVADYPTWADRKLNRLPVLYKSIQDKDFSTEFPTILTSGRLVEYEGGGDETRSNVWLAELQQNMFIEVNPFDANNLGIRDGAMVWVHGPEGGKIRVMAMLTERVGRGVAFMPFHFGGWYQGQDRRGKYPEGSDPIVLGESTNTAQTYGYDSVTQMQETKTTLCRLEAA